MVALSKICERTPYFYTSRMKHNTFVVFKVKYVILGIRVYVPLLSTGLLSLGAGWTLHTQHYNGSQICIGVVKKFFFTEQLIINSVHKFRKLRGAIPVSNPRPSTLRGNRSNL